MNNAVLLLKKAFKHTNIILFENRLFECKNHVFECGKNYQNYPNLYSLKNKNNDKNYSACRFASSKSNKTSAALKN